jgi:TctA family transporter
MSILAISTDSTVAIPLGWASIVALFVPVLTAVVTRYRDSNRAPQAIIAFTASGVLAVVQMLLDDMPNDSLLSILSGFLAVFIPMLASYIGFWQPVLDVNRKVAPDKGI